jgi:hypothetical protein
MARAKKKRAPASSFTMTRAEEVFWAGSDAGYANAPREVPDEWEDFGREWLRGWDSGALSRKRSNPRKRRNPGVGTVVAGATAQAVAPLLPVVLLGLGGWLLYRKFMAAVNSWTGDPKDPIFHPGWAANAPEWAKASGAEAAYQQAVAAGATNPVTQNPVAGPYVPPSAADWDRVTGGE